MKQLHFFKDYLTEKYGHPLQRIPLDPGFSCPHRASDGSGGCAFCAESGARARHLHAGMNIPQQVQEGISYARRRYHAEPPYIAYFQAFTGTNADTGTLKRVYEEALALADFKVLIIATRPDCLPDDCIQLLQELNKKYEVWIELGVQTAKDETLQAIHRGHNFACTVSAVTRLHQHGIRTAAHLILGLPGETRKDFCETAEKIAQLPFQAVKIHNLLILKKTAMASMYRQGLVQALNEYEYAEALSDVISILPESMLLMRLSAEAPEEQIIAPKWWMKKGQFLEMFQQMFQSRQHPDSEKNSASGGSSRFQPCRTEDGSYTLYHPQYRQHFHSVAGARTESLKKYIEPGRLNDLLENQSSVHLLDVGFGLGCNACAAVFAAESVSRGFLSITSLEADLQVLDAALSLPETSQTPIIQALKKNGFYQSDSAEVRLTAGDARQSVQTLPDHFFDLIFLDAFSPDANPELWTLDFILQLKRVLKKTGRIAAYSSAYPFYGALLEAHFHIYLSEPFGRKRGGTVASLIEIHDLQPLPEKDMLIAEKSTAGIPYRDPGLISNRPEIRKIRQEEVALKRAQGMPKWYKT